MSTPVDEYTQKYMGGGEALAHSRLRMPNWFFGLMAVIGTLQLIALILGVMVGKLGSIVGPALSLPILALTTLLFSHLRVTVTASQVAVQYGLIGPRIPIERIKSATVEPYDWKRYGGWGVRVARDGTRAYSVPNPSPNCLALEYEDEKGKSKRVVVSCENPAELMEAIRAAQSKRTGVRVAGSEASDADERVSEQDQEAVKRELERGR